MLRTRQARGLASSEATQKTASMSFLSWSRPMECLLQWVTTAGAFVPTW